MTITEEEFLAAQSVMEEALARAKLILGGFNGEEPTAKIEILTDGRARVTSWDTEYDESGLQEQVEYFPAHLLFDSEEMIAAWRAEERHKAEVASTAARLKYQRRVEADEREQYERLKAKYERK